MSDEQRKVQGLQEGGIVQAESAAGKGGAEAKSRADRQAEELRRNLLRRKAQQRQRQTGGN